MGIGGWLVLTEPIDPAPRVCGSEGRMELGEEALNPSTTEPWIISPDEHSRAISVDATANEGISVASWLTLYSLHSSTINMGLEG